MKSSNKRKTKTVIVLHDEGERRKTWWMVTWTYEPGYTVDRKAENQRKKENVDMMYLSMFVQVCTSEFISTRRHKCCINKSNQKTRYKVQYTHVSYAPGCNTVPRKILPAMSSHLPFFVLHTDFLHPQVSASSRHSPGTKQVQIICHPLNQLWLHSVDLLMTNPHSHQLLSLIRSGWSLNIEPSLYLFFGSDSMTQNLFHTNWILTNMPLLVCFRS